MTKDDAGKIADKMVKAKVSAYAGKSTLDRLLRSRARKLTDAQAAKILKAFWARVAVAASYPAIEQLYCESKLRG